MIHTCMGNGQKKKVGIQARKTSSEKIWKKIREKIKLAICFSVAVFKKAVGRGIFVFHTHCFLFKNSVG